MNKRGVKLAGESLGVPDCGKLLKRGFQLFGQITWQLGDVLAGLWLH
jgi:hypothetical protein